MELGLGLILILISAVEIIAISAIVFRDQPKA
jgi:hypothetical protein